ncbi:MAG: cytochrome P450 [Myxococcota bacterium]|nr:cytochrome P450 [Myxococcota bacterium]
MPGSVSPALCFPETDFAILPGQGAPLPRFHAMLEELREKRPVAPILFHGRPAWLLTRHVDVTEAFRDETLFSAKAVQEANTFPVMGRNIMGMEGEEHRINRALVSPHFKLRLMPEVVEEMVRPLCHDLVDGFIADGEVDLVRRFNKQLPLSAICRIIGIPPEDDDRLAGWAMALISYPWDPKGALDASRQFTNYLGELVEARRGEPRDDLLTALCREEVEGQRLSDEEIFSFVRVLFPAGADTTYLGLGSLMTALLEEPGRVEAIRGNPEAQAAAVEEALRWEAPTALLPRMVVEGGVFGGEKLGPNTVVLLGITAANRDPAVFPDPHRFDRTRKTVGHLSFGLGNHFCLGSHLARAELRVALSVLLERLGEIELQEVPIMEGAVLRGPDRLQIRFSSAR